MAAQSKPAPDSAVEAVAEPVVDWAAAAPERSGDDYRNEWAQANGLPPSEMREIRHPGGWVDRFDGRGWVQEGQ